MNATWATERKPAITVVEIQKRDAAREVLSLASISTAPPRHASPARLTPRATFYDRGVEFFRKSYDRNSAISYDVRLENNTSMARRTRPGRNRHAPEDPPGCTKLKRATARAVISLLLYPLALGVVRLDRDDPKGLFFGRQFGTSWKFIPVWSFSTPIQGITMSSCYQRGNLRHFGWV